MGQDNSPSRRRQRPRSRFRIRLRFLWILLFLVLGVPILGLAWSAFRIQSEVKAMKTNFHAQHYTAMATALSRMGVTMGMAQKEFQLLGWLKVLPMVGGYYRNALDLVTAAHWDLNAFGQVLPPLMAASESGGASAAASASMDQAVTAAGLRMQTLTPQLQQANAELGKLDPRYWPKRLSSKGLTVQTLQQVSATFIHYLPTMTGPHPLMEQLLGFGKSMRYLLIFQNSGELRATGGFMTAYAEITFDKGKMGKIVSQNIENLDQKVTLHPTPPLIVGTYLPVDYWHLRDANTSMPGPNALVPDTPEAAANIFHLYNTIPAAPPLDGLIFVNTWFVDDLIGDVGGLDVPAGPGKTVHITAQNANLEMEHMAEGRGLAANVRKLFIGTMMKELMKKVFHGNLPVLLKVVQTVGKALTNENLMLYFQNPQMEHYVVAHHWGGVIPVNVNGNFMEVIDQNLLGHKDNYWLKESYQVDITTSPNGRNLESVTINWLDPEVVSYQPPALSVPYRSWATVFAPAGSTLVSMHGSVAGGAGDSRLLGMNSAAQAAFDPLVNKEEFGAHMSLPGRMTIFQPPATGTLTIKFWLPTDVNILRMLLQKQPGLQSEPVSVTVNGMTQNVNLINRQTLTFSSSTSP